MSNGQQQSQEGAEMEILYISGGICLGLAALFFFFQDQILSAVLWTKYYELRIISFFMPTTHFQALEHWAQLAHAQQVSYQQLALISQEIGDAIKIPSAIISAILGVVLYTFHPHRLYSDIETTYSLADKVGRVFPAIKVVEGSDLINTPIDQGLWAMGLTPIEFAKKYRLIQRNKQSGNLEINRLRAKMAFNSQLGRKWRGIEDLRPYEKAIFAAFAAFVNYKRSEGEALLEQIAASVKKRNLLSANHDFSGVNRLLKKYGNSSAVEQIGNNHAYVLTVFIEMLNQARGSGIVANSLYLWLKPVDRRLWYTLNSVGRKAVYTEAAAAYAHWIVETKVGYPIVDPMIEQAIEGLEDALHSRVVEHSEEDEGEALADDSKAGKKASKAKAKAKAKVRAKDEQKTKTKAKAKAQQKKASAKSGAKAASEQNSDQRQVEEV